MGGYDGGESSAPEQTTASEFGNTEYGKNEKKSGPGPDTEENESNPKQGTPTPDAEENLPSIVINGRPLNRETVVKIKKLSRFGTLVGINMKDMDLLTGRSASSSTQQSQEPNRLNNSDTSATNTTPNTITSGESVTSNSGNYDQSKYPNNNMSYDERMRRKKIRNDRKKTLT